MFYILCLTLCLAVMVLVTGGTMAASVPLARVLQPLVRRLPASVAANLVFAFRLFPFLLGIVVSAGLALPAFLEFEPRSTHEMLDWPLLSLAVIGALGFGVLIFRTLHLMVSTRRWVREQESAAQRLSSSAHGAALYRTSGASSLLAVAGMFRPRVFLSADVADSLSPQEVDAAISHELAHVRSWDNLKQLLLKIIRLPRWVSPIRELDHAWTQCSEMAADERALAAGASPLDLSSALIKVARLAAPANGYAAITASHLVPCECKSATATRAARLRQILETGKLPQARSRSASLLRVTCSLLVGCAVYLICLAYDCVCSPALETLKTVGTQTATSTVSNRKTQPHVPNRKGDEAAKAKHHHDGVSISGVTVCIVQKRFIEEGYEYKEGEGIHHRHAQQDQRGSIEPRKMPTSANHG